jgi:serine protease inhibitor
MGLSCLLAASGLWGSVTGCRGRIGMDTTTAVQKELPASGQASKTFGARFGWNLFHRLAQEEPHKNVFISPASLSFALSMTANGAQGETLRAMLRTLDSEGLALEEINHRYDALRMAWTKPGSGVQMRVANALWADRGFTYLPGFSQRARAFYGAETTSLDFRSAEAPATINGWVDQTTGGKIRQILTANDLLNAEAVLTNAIYFKADWERPFDRALTRPGDFHLPDGTTRQIPMMRQNGRFYHLQGEGFQAVRMPYAAKRFSFYLFLPEKGVGMPAFLSKLNADNWKRWVGGFREMPLQLTMPRFKLGYEAELSEPLSKMGMEIAFSPQADFGAMASGPLWISKVKHKTVLEVNEEGSEAAGATAVIMTRGAPLAFSVDRPFFCAIRDETTGETLFMGTVNQPGA